MSFSGLTSVVLVLFTATILMAGSARAEGPDAAMMAPPQKLARFLETGDQAHLDGAFSEGEVVILENFAPHLFVGQAGLREWRAQMLAHVGSIKGLRHSFGAAKDFGTTADTVYFTLPTTWTGVQRGKRFSELGGWSFLLVQEGGIWRIRSYGWAVVTFKR